MRGRLNALTKRLISGWPHTAFLTVLLGVCVFLNVSLALTVRNLRQTIALFQNTKRHRLNDLASPLEVLDLQGTRHAVSYSEGPLKEDIFRSYERYLTKASIRDESRIEWFLHVSQLLSRPELGAKGRHRWLRILSDSTNTTIRLNAKALLLRL